MKRKSDKRKESEESIAKNNSETRRNFENFRNKLIKNTVHDEQDPANKLSVQQVKATLLAQLEQSNKALKKTEDEILTKDESPNHFKIRCNASGGNP